MPHLPAMTTASRRPRVAARWPARSRRVPRSKRPCRGVRCRRRSRRRRSPPPPPRWRLPVSCQPAASTRARMGRPTRVTGRVGGEHDSWFSSRAACRGVFGKSPVSRNPADEVGSLLAEKRPVCHVGSVMWACCASRRVLFVDEGVVLGGDHADIDSFRHRQRVDKTVGAVEVLRPAEQAAHRAGRGSGHEGAAVGRGELRRTGRTSPAASDRGPAPTDDPFAVPDDVDPVDPRGRRRVRVVRRANRSACTRMEHCMFQ